ncbi:MAG: alpha/beta hydrolase [candidate division KSB1 bacterium]|nr:alpha/beta hydrolase [candidate division KSB1 bacterium]MDZ7317548.1 alpha/beta hydrolase [candidate division KSB1 bacterium]MDZ7340941.1 alpha/beta hydrolase [candidate division KSB1 bacterium]
MRSKRLQFTGSLGYKLSGLLDLPDEGEPKAFGIFAHCFTCNKNYKILNHIDQVLTANQLAVLRFDFTGLGASLGQFGTTNFSSNVNDILAAANFLTLNYDAPQILIGHSFGGAAAILAAMKLPACRAVVTIATPADFASIRNLLLSHKAELEQYGEAQYTISGRQFVIQKQFLDDLERYDLKKSLADLHRPLLICHSVGDELVPFAEAEALFAAARQPKSLVSLDQADHLVSDEKHGEYAGKLIVAWASLYLKI